MKEDEYYKHCEQYEHYEYYECHEHYEHYEHYIVVQQSSTASLTGLPVLRTLY